MMTKKLKTYFSYSIFILLVCSLGIQAQEASNDSIAQENIHRLQSELAKAYTADGSRAVMARIETLSQNPDELEALANLVAQSGEKVKIKIGAHQNEADAIAWINERFGRMELPLAFDAEFSSDATLNRGQTPEEEIKKLKVIRYLAAPGIAMAFTAYGMVKGFFFSPEETKSASDVLVMMIPTLGVGVTTVLLEYQFAHPYLNSHFWTPLWKKGGAIGGRAINIVVNTLYGVSLYAAGKASSFIPAAFGYEAIDFPRPSFPSLFGWAPGSEWVHQMPDWGYVITASLIGGIFFHLALGQFQTDLSIEERGRRSMTNRERYREETLGVVVNNGARVTAAAAPGFDVSGAAWAAWFAIKTLPQIIRTHILPARQDKRIKKRVCRSALGALRKPLP